MNSNQFNEILFKLDEVLGTMQSIYEALVEIVPVVEVVEEDGTSTTL